MLARIQEATLDRMIKSFLEWGDCPADLNEHVESLPLGKLSQPPTAFTSTSDTEETEEQRQVREWWHANSARLIWDGRKRKFTAGEASSPR